MSKKQTFMSNSSLLKTRLQIDPEYGLLCSPQLPKMLTKELSAAITKKLIILANGKNNALVGHIRDEQGNLTYAAEKEIFRIIQHDLETAKDALPEDLGLADKI